MRSHTPPSASNAPASSRAADPGLGYPLHRYGIFFLIAAAGCAADLLTKHWIFQWRGLPRGNGIWWVWEPFVGVETALNTGALFGLGAGHGRLLAVLSVGAAIGILYWMFYLQAARQLWLTIALACVMGGVLGNLYDRLGLWSQPGVPEHWSSAVRDWILLRYGSLSWPNFNIADSLLVCGAAMLMWHAIREQPAPTKGEASARLVNDGG